MRALSIGEILWDVFPDREHLGGAPFNMAFHLSKLGHEVAMHSAVGDDPRGRLSLEQAARGGLDIRFIQRIDELPTGVTRVGVDREGGVSFRLERPAAYDRAELRTARAAAIADWNPAWICFGTLFHIVPETLESTERLLKACPAAGRFYDVNLRPGQYSAELVTRLAGLANVLKLSEEEAPEVAGLLGEPYRGREEFVRRLAERFGYGAVCLTRGKDGCAVHWKGEYSEHTGRPVTVVDAVGAGDAFSAAFLHGWASGQDARRTAEFANRVGGLVASRAGATPEWSLSELASD